MDGVVLFGSYLIMNSCHEKNYVWFIGNDTNQNFNDFGFAL